ncbi:Cytochrome P450 711A1 [Dichanthelium oligosanthes]|uniref:Cytochrome P450 711A1 n=1 Tax=Dichanthelium oligosanthes TaxID=888268 RepID=A0A1E5W4Z0_9POAL|nr:Cytochrome P450 711A1 [Dichanthelium oligosanthes]
METATSCNGALEAGPVEHQIIPVLVLISFVSLFSAFLIYFYAPFWSVRRVPGPPTRFPVGHLHLLAKNGPDVFRAIAKEYGPIFRFHMGRQPLVIVANAELCKEVGIKKFKYIRNRSTPPPTIGSLHQDALFLTRDSTWSAMRNTVVPLYQPARLAGLIPVMQSYVDVLVANIAGCPDQDCIPFCQLSLRMAIDIIGKTAFGVEFGLSKNSADSGGSETDGNSEDDDDVREFLKEYKRSMEFIKMDLSSSLSTILGLFLPCVQTPCRRLLRRVPGTADYKMDENERRLCRRIDAIIAGRRRDRAARRRGGDGDSDAARSAPLDFIAALLDAMENGGGAKDFALEDRHVRALAYEHLIAGTKTTAFTLSSVVYLVSCHPRVEEKLLRELEGFAPPDGPPPNADELQSRFPYLDQVIKEAMRFHLVSPLIARQTSERVEIGGYVIPKGAYVWLAPGVLARDAAQFPEPEEFRPERFAAEAEEERARHPYAHIPFGVGPRACIGHKFALQQVKLAVVELYRRYVFRHSPAMESPIQFDFDLVLAFRHGVKLRAIRRE